MRYTEFKERVEREFINYLPDEYKCGKVKVTAVDKINVVLDSLTVYCGEDIYPTIYIQGMYEKYKQNGDFEATMRISAGRYADAAHQSKNMSLKLDPRNIKENVVFRLVNTEANKSLLRKVPHREFEDLSFVYIWVIEFRESETVSSLINNDLAGQFGFDEEKLFRNAMDNTPRLLPLDIQNIESIIEGIMQSMEPSANDLEALKCLAGQPVPMYVITNKSKQYGAGAVFYKDALHKVAEKEQKNLFLIPSSVHEMIAVPVDDKDSDIPVLLKMIHEVNRAQVSLSERLSNELYFYDLKLRHFCKISNVNMSIDFTENGGFV